MAQASRPASLTSLAIAVLALLTAEPAHPYQMRHEIRVREIDRVMKVTHGTLYSTVDRLAAAGLIQPVETSREGRRPERTVYEITPPGRDQLLDTLRAELMRPAPSYPKLATALAFATLLSADEVASLLQRRSIEVESQLSAMNAAMDASLKSRSHPLKRVHLIEVEYQVALLRAEHDWLTALIEDIREGRLTWEAAIHE
ncbi:MAG TPA: PadR family transcriptional regulator [Trebonia sp.]|nr:PadR family transcriptional regulator [Trebonia sp.]